MINSLKLSDYDSLKEFVDMLKSVYSVLNKEGLRIEIGNEHRYWEYASALSLVKRGDHVLDVGSGYSLLGPALSILLNCQVTEYEPDPNMVESRRQVNEFLAAKDYRLLNVINAGFNDIGLLAEEKKYDVVTCVSVLEHISKVAEATAWIELGSRVRIGGYLFVTVDCVPEKKPYGSYTFDNLRQTNYTPKDLKVRWDELVHPFTPGIEFDSTSIPDWNYNGSYVHDYTFFRMALRRVR